MMIRSKVLVISAVLALVGGVAGCGGSSGSDGSDATSGNCDPSYEGACVPNDGADYNCADINGTDFQSVGTDPHGLDRDGDGIACES